MTTLELIHFNDVYHASPSKDEPIGGASRFATKVNEIRSQSDLEPLVLFSGDAFNPSLEGTITRGSHMPEILNQFHIAAACLGNHDFDFGMPQLEKLIGQTNFPWLLSNVLNGADTAHQRIDRYLVLEHAGLRLGFVGLVEKEWIQTIPSFPPELTYYDFVQVAKDLSKELKDPEGPHKVDLVIALTHMRVPNDVKLAKSCKGEIDLVLGGHDHFYYVSNAVDIIGDNWAREKNLDDVGYDPEQIVEGDEEEEDDERYPVRVVKSGTDFREFSYLKIEIESDSDTGKKYIKDMSAEREVIDSSVQPDEATEELVENVAKLVSSKTKTAIGYTTVPLDGRSMTVRTEETNLGNLTADLMMMYYKNIQTPAEIGFCVGGTIRNDSIIEVGEITLGDILTAFPFLDPIVVIRVTGRQLWDALENSVSEYPKQEGRFPQLAGIRLEWNPEAPSGSRVRRVFTCKKHLTSVELKERSGHRRSLSFPNMLNRKERYEPENMIPLSMEREYIVATRNYLIGGYDGYTAFKVPEDKIIVDEERGVLVSTLYRKYFLGLKYINAFREYQAKHVHHEDRIKKLVASAAAHWRSVSKQFRRHNHPNDGRDCDCDTSSQDGRSFLESDIKQRADYHISTEAIGDAFVDSSKGHPNCIDSEDAEENGPNSKYNADNDVSWVKRWASISPVVEGRIVRVDY
ncbi:Metallo-dependent phosphatase-like protein [Mucor mucedo]|uniref:Metallo-dependent phosphatase-like protein n=1 Tax=Mucor mucedo TaxID=29922 RepID=UPI002220911A|nr:Metallo-dependent phosphatase-like protein [Mucor mucedo]KAI7891813.1 Metallo-dependent phosphatase-like protein [Mucor mucedo]